VTFHSFANHGKKENATVSFELFLCFFRMQRFNFSSTQGSEKTLLSMLMFSFSLATSRIKRARISLLTSAALALITMQAIIFTTADSATCLRYAHSDTMEDS